MWVPGGNMKEGYSFWDMVYIFQDLIFISLIVVLAIALFLYMKYVEKKNTEKKKIFIKKRYKDVKIMIFTSAFMTIGLLIGAGVFYFSSIA